MFKIDMFTYSQYVVRFFFVLLYVPIFHREPGKHEKAVVFDFYGIFICIRISVSIAVEGMMSCIEYARGVQSSP